MSQSYVRLPTSNSAGTPYTAGSTLTDQDFDIRALVRVPSYTFSGRTYVTGQAAAGAGWMINFETTGLVRFTMTTTAGDRFLDSTSTPEGVAAAGEWVWIRITRVTGNVNWYAATPANALLDSWTSLRAQYTADTNPIVAYTTYGVGVRAYNSSGSGRPGGDAYLDVSRVLIYRGGLAGSGTLVRDFDPSRATAGQPGTFTGPDDETWTFTGTTYEVVHVGTPVTLSPDGFVSASGIEDQAAGTTDLHLAIDDSPDDSDADTTYLVNSGSATGTAWVTLSNTPSDFGEMLTLSVRVRARQA